MEKLLQHGFTYKSYYRKKTPQGTLIYSLGTLWLYDGDRIYPVYNFTTDLWFTYSQPTGVNTVKN